MLVDLYSFQDADNKVWLLVVVSVSTGIPPHLAETPWVFIERAYLEKLPFTKSAKLDVEGVRLQSY